MKNLAIAVSLACGLFIFQLASCTTVSPVRNLEKEQCEPLPLTQPSQEPEPELTISSSLRSVTFLLGPSTPGKSALLHLLANDGGSLHVYKQRNGQLVAANANQDRTRPQQILLRAPALGEEHTIYNMAADANLTTSHHRFAGKLFQHFRSPTFAIVLSFDDLMNPHSQGWKWFTNEDVHVDNMETSLGLVVIDAPHQNPANGRTFKSSEILRYIRSSLWSYRKELVPSTDSKAHLVDILLKPSRISFLQRPRQCGPLMEDKQVVRSLGKIREMLRSLHSEPKGILRQAPITPTPCVDVTTTCTGPTGFIALVPGGCSNSLNQLNCQKSCQLCPVNLSGNNCPVGASPLCQSSPNCTVPILKAACPRECKLCTPPPPPTTTTTTTTTPAPPQPSARYNCIWCRGRQECCGGPYLGGPNACPGCRTFCVFGVYFYKCNPHWFG